MSKEYRVSHKCRNCKTPSWFDIPRGVEALVFLKQNNKLCSYCNVVLIPESFSEETPTPRDEENTEENPL